MGFYLMQILWERNPDDPRPSFRDAVFLKVGAIPFLEDSQRKSSTFQFASKTAPWLYSVCRLPHKAEILFRGDGGGWRAAAGACWPDQWAGQCAASTVSGRSTAVRFFESFQASSEALTLQ